ncbi:hypothetical protein V8C42DRAFT_14616 [Trichoderma barbatum]
MRRKQDAGPSQMRVRGSTAHKISFHFAYCLVSFWFYLFSFMIFRRSQTRKTTQEIFSDRSSTDITSLDSLGKRQIHQDRPRKLIFPFSMCVIERPPGDISSVIQPRYTLLPVVLERGVRSTPANQSLSLSIYIQQNTKPHYQGITMTKNDIAEHAALYILVRSMCQVISCMRCSSAAPIAICTTSQSRVPLSCDARQHHNFYCHS